MHLILDTKNLIPDNSFTQYSLHRPLSSLTQRCKFSQRRQSCSTQTDRQTAEIECNIHRSKKSPQIKNHVCNETCHLNSGQEKSDEATTITEFVSTTLLTLSPHDTGMPSTRLASTSSESSRRNGFLSGLDESGGESSAVAAASVVAMAIEGIRDDDDDTGRLFGADQQQVWKANLDSAPLGTSYSGGSIDRSIGRRPSDNHFKVKPCNSSSLPASLLAPESRPA